MKSAFAAFSVLLSSSVFCLSAHATPLQCWIGDRSEDDTAENFTFDAKDSTFEWSGGEASHPSSAKFQALGEKVVIAVILKPPTQAGEVLTEDKADKILSIYIDQDRKYHIQGDMSLNGDCEQ